MRPLMIITVLAFVCPSFAHAQTGGGFDLSWSTIDGGGGTSAGGGFTLSGTIGQPDASLTPMTGGSFTLTGGFWVGATPPNQCPCDWNGVDGLDSQDFFDFLDGFFQGNADFNGVDGTDSQDYFEFLECFFVGCQ